MINLGIIGLGGISQWLHINNARESGKFYIKAAADIRPDDGTAQRLGIPNYYTDYKELLKDEEIDAVLVATPHHLHEEHCVAAFKAGKHVILEKPISRNLQEARNIMQAAKESGKIAMLAFCERFDPVHWDIKKRLEKGELGQLLSARIDHYQNFNPPTTSWWRSADMVGGGAVIGSGVHRLDLLRWYFGEPVKVYASAVDMPERLEAEACVHAVITFDSGVIANFSINWATYGYLYYEGLSISGKDGMLVRTNEYYMGHKTVDNGALKPIGAPPIPSMYQHFAECIENNKQPITSFEEGYKSLRLVRAIYKSIETGQIINPEEVDF